MEEKFDLGMFLISVVCWLMLSIAWMGIVGVVLFLLTLVIKAITFNWIFVFLGGLIGGTIQMWKESRE
ncbi:hypothetical protein K9L27_00495 [Candidatus Gracilibacteria bacterium]|nr:hypothetical protein [Candidatus Gracilibacteria bacterium]